MLREGVVGIDGDGMCDLLQQRQVVVRVAVEPTVVEFGLTLAQPVLQSLYFAVFKTGDAGAAPGVVLAVHLDLGGDQVFDAETCGDGRSHEAIGRGDDDERVALSAVFFHQGAGVR